MANHSQEETVSTRKECSHELIHSLKERGYNAEPLLDCMIHRANPEAYAESLQQVYTELAEYYIRDPEFSDCSDLHEHLYMIRRLYNVLYEMKE